MSGPRPCPYAGCQYHLYLDVSLDTGSIKLNFPDLEVWEMGESCALDIADRGGMTLEDVGQIMNLTRERIRQLEVMVLDEVTAKADALREFVDGESVERLPLHAPSQPGRGRGLVPPVHVGHPPSALRKRVAEVLTTRGMTRVVAAREMGVDINTLTAWLNSAGDYPSKTYHSVYHWLTSGSTPPPSTP